MHTDDYIKESMTQLTDNQQKEIREEAGRYHQPAESRQFAAVRIAVVTVAALALIATRLVPDLDPVIAAGLTFASFGLLLGTMYLARMAQTISQRRAPRPIRVRASEEQRVDGQSRPFEGR